MRTFKGSLREGDYHVGTFITTSSFSNPAINSAEQGYIRLIDGERLSDIMLQSGLGVTQEGDNDYATDWDFWELFEIERDDLIRSDAVPQADNLNVLNIVLCALDNGKTVKPEIHPVMEAETSSSWQPRQADYYAAAGWAMGLVHKDTTDDYDGRQRQKWTLSRTGAEYVEHLKSGNERAAEEVLNESIRKMEIAKRVLRELKQQGTMTHEEIEKLVHENTLPEEYERGLKDTTSYRRAKSIARYIERLPEVVRHPPSNGQSHHLKGSTYEYLEKGITDY
jgi:restriction system protein